MKATGDKLDQVAGSIFFLYVLIVVPLYMHNGYFDLLQAKSDAVVVILIPVTLYILARIIQRIIQKTFSWKPQLIDIGMMILAAAALAGGILSGHFSESLWGKSGWGVGIFILCTGFLAVIYFSRRCVLHPYLWIPVVLVSIFVFLIGILHGAGVDVFSLHKMVVEKQYFDYISTLGQSNWVSGYLCLLLPVYILFYFTSRTRYATILFLIAVILGLLSASTCAADSFYLGIGFCFLFAIPFICRNAERMWKLFLIFAIFGINLILVRFLPPFQKAYQHAKGISETFFKIPVIAAVTIIGIAGFLFFYFMRDRYDRSSEKVKRVLCLVIVGLLVAVIIGFLIHSILTFSDKFGTRRGLIWRILFEQYRELPILKKIFGIGPELVGYYSSELIEFFHMPVLAAHSQPLQLLLTTGLLGIAGWAVVWISLFAGYFKKKLWKEDNVILFVPLAAYFAQSFVNTSMATVFITFCLLLICFRSSFLEQAKSKA